MASAPTRGRLQHGRDAAAVPPHAPPDARAPPRHAAGAQTHARAPGGRATTQPIGFWRAGRWVPRARTASEERLHRGGQGPTRTARRQGRVVAWMDGSFRPAAFRRGVMPHDAPAMQAIRAQMAAALEAGAAPFVPTSRRWSLQQWEDWEAWSNPLLVVDWAGQGLPDWEFVPDEEDDEGVFMQLTAAEEDILHRMQVPDEVRRRIRDMLRTLVNHQNEDVGAEYRWGLRRWLLAWQEGCTQLGQVVEILQQRVQGPVAYYPVVRDPRGRAQRERCIAFNRQWTAVLLPLLETLVDGAMVAGCAAEPQGDAVRPPRERSRSRDGSGSSASTTSARFRTHRARRVVGRPVSTSDEAASAARSPVARSSNSESGGSAVLGDDDTDTSGLVQRLQPEEARRLACLGVRRQTITALGRFLENLAVVSEGGTRRDMDVRTVQWCLHTTDRAIQMAIGMQDQVLGVLTCRLRRGRAALPLPDEEQRGESAQMAHELVVGLARAYLLALHDGVANSWLDPETLPDVLRGRDSDSESLLVDAAAGEDVRDRSRSPVREVPPEACPVGEPADGADARGRSHSPVEAVQQRASTSGSAASSTRVTHGGEDAALDGDGVQMMQRMDVLLNRVEVEDVDVQEIEVFSDLRDRLREAHEVAAAGSRDVGVRVAILVEVLHVTTRRLRRLYAAFWSGLGGLHLAAAYRGFVGLVSDLVRVVVGLLGRGPVHCEEADGEPMPDPADRSRSPHRGWVLPVSSVAGTSGLDSSLTSTTTTSALF